MSKDSLPLAKFKALDESTLDALKSAGYRSVEELATAPLEDLVGIENIDRSRAQEILEQANQLIERNQKSPDDGEPGEPRGSEDEPDRGVNRDERPKETLQRLRELNRIGGGKENIRAQHERDKKTARERIKYLFDADSFRPIDRLVERRSYEFDETKRHVPGDGVLCGIGTINGRRVACFSQDFTVMGGSLSEEHGRKIAKLMDLAYKHRIPLIGLNDSGGARIQDGVRSLASYAEIFRRNTEYSGRIPQLSLIMGPCAGGAVYSPAISDLLFMVEESSFMYVTGPDVVRTVTGEELSHRDLGGSDVHRHRSGVAHGVGESEQKTLDLAVKALSYLPDHHGERPDRREPRPPSTDRPLEEIVPEDKTKPYDVREVITALVDGDSFFELQPQFARNLVIGFARLDGICVGVVANQPKYNAGTLDIDASDKGARFVRLCNSFNLPIITLEDVPGFLPGKDQEAGGIIRHGAKFLYAYAEADVPLITVILRKSYGGAYCVMASKHLGADFNYAWPMAEIAVMGPESAVEVIHGDEIRSSEDPRKARNEKISQLRDQFGNPWEAARRGYLDDVITPDETRDRIVESLKLGVRRLPLQDERPPGNPPV